MAHEINKEHTIIDFFDVLIQHNELVGINCEAVSLTTQEWAQFKALVEANYVDLKDKVVVINDNLILYKDIKVYYDGCANGKIQYWDNLDMYRNEIQRIHARVRNPEVAREPINRPRPINHGNIAQEPVQVLAGDNAYDWNDVHQQVAAYPFIRTPTRGRI